MPSRKRTPEASRRQARARRRRDAEAAAIVAVADEAEALLAAQRQADESEDQHRAARPALTDAPAQVVSGGLPSLGKRR